MHIIVVAFAVSLTFSALYICFERDQFTDVLYGSTYHTLVLPNSNVTIPLGAVSDRFETGDLAVRIGCWRSRNKTLSVRRPVHYGVEANLLVSVAVNKSAFVILEKYGGSRGNKTVDVLTFQSGNWEGMTQGSTFHSNMEVNQMYQLKIGNYETFFKNQTEPTEPRQFTIENTNGSLEVLVGASSFPRQMTPFSPPDNKYTLTFTREPNLYLVTVLLVIDLLLAVIYFALSRK